MLTFAKRHLLVRVLFSPMPRPALRWRALRRTAVRPQAQELVSCFWSEYSCIIAKASDASTAWKQLCQEGRRQVLPKCHVRVL